SCMIYLSVLLFLANGMRGVLSILSFPTRRSSDLEVALHIPKGEHSHGAGVDQDEPQPVVDQPQGAQEPVDGKHTQNRGEGVEQQDRKSTRLNSSHVSISYAVFCLKERTSRLSLIQ